ncbi:hypothetical protein [Dinoroseobacter sp. S375]|uniref:hypothetical protein n=1 Tax=Dinoroseobacter sp. S375 TaxID=3415136 RepID=UPI003C7CC6AD
MRALILATLAVSLSGCVTSLRSTPAVCDGTRSERVAHADALLTDGGPLSVATGSDLLSKLHAGCT